MLFTALYEGAVDTDDLASSNSGVIVNVDPDDSVTLDHGDYNADEHEYAQRVDIDPDGDVDDIEESAAMANYYLDYNWSQIMESVGLREISEAAAGRRIVYEAGDVAAFVRKAKDNIVAFVKKVGEWIGNFIASLRATFRNDEKFLRENIGAIKAGYKNANSIEIKNQYKYDSKKIANYLSDFKSGCNAIYHSVSQIDDSGNANTKFYDNPNDFSTGVTSTRSAFASPETINNDCRGEKKVDYKADDINLGDITDALSNTEKTIGNIKSCYKSFEAACNKALKYIEKAEKKAARETYKDKEQKEDKSNAIKAINDKIAACDKIMKDANSTLVTLCSILRSRATLYRSVAKKLITKGEGKKNYKDSYSKSGNDEAEPTSESYRYCGSGFLSDVTII